MAGWVLPAVLIVGGLALAAASSGRRPAGRDLYAPTAEDRKLLASRKQIWVTFDDRDERGKKIRAVEGPFPSRAWAEDYAHGSLAPDRRARVVVSVSRPRLARPRTRLGGAP